MVLGEESHLFRGPAAFGAYGECGIQGLRDLTGTGECRGEGGGLFGLGEKDEGGAGLLFEGEFEGDGVVDVGDVGAAGLFCCFESDAAPAFDSLGGGQGEVLLGAASEDGGDTGDAELGGFFDGPLEVIELEDGEEQVEGKGGIGLELFVEGEEDFLLGDGDDFGAVEEAVSDDVVDLAGFGAKDAGEVEGLIAGEGGGVGGDLVGDEAAASHWARYSLLGTGYRVLGTRLLGFGEFDGEGLLVVEVDGDGGGFALVPGGLGDGKVEDEHSGGGGAGFDLGLAEEQG